MHKKINALMMDGRIAASHLLHLEDEACLGLNDDEEGSIDYDNQIDPEIKLTLLVEVFFPKIARFSHLKSL